MTIYKMVSELAIWLVLVPFLVGILPSHLVQKTNKRLSTVYLCGWLLMVSVFQVVATFFVVKMYTLTSLTLVYSIIVAVLVVVSVAFGIFGLVKSGSKTFFQPPLIRSLRKIDLFTWIFFYCIVVAQVIFSVMVATPNGDDAFYVATAVVADHTDRLFTISPYVGFTEDLHMRHALAEFSIFYAFLARCSGVHATIIAHTVMPLVLIPITYMIYYRVAANLFDDNRSKVPVFMGLIALIQMFGATSVYTNEIFFLTRTWQGKSMLANIAIPAVFLMVLKIAKESESKRKIRKKLLGYYLVLFMINLVGAFASSLGLLLLSMMEEILLLCVAVRNRNYRIILLSFFSIIPCLVYICMYVF